MKLFRRLYESIAYPISLRVTEVFQSPEFLAAASLSAFAIHKCLCLDAKSKAVIPLLSLAEISAPWSSSNRVIAVFSPRVWCGIE